MPDLDATEPRMAVLRGWNPIPSSPCSRHPHNYLIPCHLATSSLSGSIKCVVCTAIRRQARLASFSTRGIWRNCDIPQGFPVVSAPLSMKTDLEPIPNADPVRGRKVSVCRHCVCNSALRMRLIARFSLCEPLECSASRAVNGRAGGAARLWMTLSATPAAAPSGRKPSVVRPRARIWRPPASTLHPPSGDSRSTTSRS